MLVHPPGGVWQGAGWLHWPRGAPAPAAAHADCQWDGRAADGHPPPQAGHTWEPARHPDKLEQQQPGHHTGCTAELRPAPSSAAGAQGSVLSEQPLKGSLLRKLPVLRQAIHLLLPSERDAADFLTGVAADLLSSQAGSGAGAGSVNHSRWDVSPEAAGPTAHSGCTEARDTESSAAGAEADSSLGGLTRWGPQHTDTPAFGLRPSAVQGGAVVGARDIHPDNDQSAAFDLAKQFSYDKSAQAAAGLGSSAMEPWGPYDAGSKEGGYVGSMGLAGVNTLQAKPFRCACVDHGRPVLC